MRLVLMTGALLALAGCDAEVRTPVQGDERVAMKADADGRVSFDMPFVKGDLKLPSGLMANSNFDIYGVKMIPGGQLTGFNLDAGGSGQPKVNLSFTAPTSPEAVKTYFLDQFRAQGVGASLVADAIQGTTKDGSSFTMRFSPAGNGTSGTIELDPKR